jgi:hypothetical protein
MKQMSIKRRTQTTAKSDKVSVLPGRDRSGTHGLTFKAESSADGSGYGSAPTKAAVRMIDSSPDMKLMVPFCVSFVQRPAWSSARCGIAANKTRQPAASNGTPEHQTRRSGLQQPFVKGRCQQRRSTGWRQATELKPGASEAAREYR